MLTLMNRGMKLDPPQLSLLECMFMSTQNEKILVQRANMDIVSKKKMYQVVSLHSLGFI